MADDDLIEPATFREMGLEMFPGWSGIFRDRMRSEDEIEKRFHFMFGSDADVVSIIWYDLRTTDITEAQLDKDEYNDPKLYLMSLYFLRHYAKGWTLEAFFRPHTGKDIKEARLIAWWWTGKIAALKALKIVFPDRFTDEGYMIGLTESFGISLDGVDHKKPETRQHPTEPYDPKECSHKMKHAAWRYEIGLSVFEDKCIHINGPKKAGRDEIGIFKEPGGLRDKMVKGRCCCLLSVVCSLLSISISHILLFFSCYFRWKGQDYCG
jgi:hypothetical protein